MYIAEIELSGFKFTMMSGDGVVVPPDVNVDNPEFFPAFKRAINIYPCFWKYEHIRYYYHGVPGYIKDLHYSQYEDELKDNKDLMKVLKENFVSFPALERMLNQAITELVELIPEIDRLANEEAKRQDLYLFRKNRPLVYERDGGVCQYCGKVLGKSYSVDHIIPRMHGGSSNIDNLTLCCRSCNSSKGARTPEQAGMVIAQ